MFVFIPPDIRSGKLKPDQNGDHNADPSSQGQLCRLNVSSVITEKG